MCAQRATKKKPLRRRAKRAPASRFVLQCPLSAISQCDWYFGYFWCYKTLTSVAFCEFLLLILPEREQRPKAACWTTEPQHLLKLIWNRTGAKRQITVAVESCAPHHWVWLGRHPFNPFGWCAFVLLPSTFFILLGSIERLADNWASSHVVVRLMYWPERHCFKCLVTTAQIRAKS